jgi:hypothetical protein
LAYSLKVTRLALADPVDLRGLPDTHGDTTRWLVPADFPQEGCPPTIWFFDEWPQGSIACQNAAGQLLHERRLGDYVLPDNVYICAAGNRAKHRAGTSGKMPTHIADRFTHLDVETDLNDWSRYMLAAGHPVEVVAFCRFRSELLSAFDPAEDVSPTPRSWADLSSVFVQNPPSEIELALYSGKVGAGAATEFVGFLRVFKTLPNIDNIILNPTTAPVPTEPSTLYALATGLARKATDGNFDRVVSYAKRLPAEFGVLLVSAASKRDPEIQRTRAFIGWASENAEFML